MHPPCVTYAETICEDQTTDPEREKVAVLPHKIGKMNMQLVESRLYSSSSAFLPAGSKFVVIFMVIAHLHAELRRQTLNYSEC